MVPRRTLRRTLGELQDAGADPKHLGVDALELARLVPADLSAYPEMFLNVNTPEDRADLEARLVDDSTT